MRCKASGSVRFRSDSDKVAGKTTDRMSESLVSKIERLIHFSLDDRSSSILLLGYFEASMATDSVSRLWVVGCPQPAC